MSQLAVSDERWRVLGVGLMLVTLLLAGCGDGRPRTIEAHGRVTLRGQPLETGTITFQPTRSRLWCPLRLNR